MQDEETEALIEESRGDMNAMLKAVHCMTLRSPGKLGWTGHCTKYGLPYFCTMSSFCKAGTDMSSVMVMFAGTNGPINI